MKKFRTKTLTTILAGVVSASMVFTLSFAPALASAADSSQDLAAAGASQLGVPEWAVDDGEDMSEAAGELTEQAFPATYDLRSEGLVTNVKLQNPWQSCWAFGGIAAAETSILSAAGTTYAKSGLDLSERHLAYFSFQPISASEDPAQAGEGIRLFETTKPNAELDAGGKPIYVTSLFSQGVGPLPEKAFPYHGKNGIFDSSGAIKCYDPTDDWTIPATNSQGNSNRLLTGGYVLKDGNVLPQYWASANKTPGVDNAVGIQSIKQELLNGHGVSIMYWAMQSGDCVASDAEGTPQAERKGYNYAQYIYPGKTEVLVPGQPEVDISSRFDHAVCVVGWDDNYKKENFNAAHQPTQDGAWIVKNSWGSETDGDFVDDLGNKPNYLKYGAIEDGKYSGYFYLSYEDATIQGAESMEFSSNLYTDEGFYTVQYDYMPAANGFYPMTMPNSTQLVSSANVFTADEAMQVKSVSTRTSTENMRVTYAIYLLKDGATNPTDGTLAYRTSKNYELAGFHRLDLDQPLKLKKGQRYSVVSTTSTLDGSGNRNYSVSVAMGVSEAKAHELGLKFYDPAVVNPGESFIFNPQTNAWEDWSEQVKTTFATINKDFPLDNFGIKVYAVPDYSPETGQAMHRLYNPYSGEHFYTASDSESAGLVKAGWRDEGTGWKAPNAGDEVYRLYNPYAGDHHYTTSADERDGLVKAGWKDEGVGWLSGGTVPLYRQYNPYAETGTHNYTASLEENNSLVALGWKGEGIGWYGVG